MAAIHPRQLRIAVTLLALLCNRSVGAGRRNPCDPMGMCSRRKFQSSLLVNYQERKREESGHPLLSEKIPIALVPRIQARLLAQTLRGDVEASG
jgi:hypothetical protein